MQIASDSRFIQKFALKFFGVLIVAFFCFAAQVAQAEELKADFRHRPPEMVSENGLLSGPLKDILDEAAQKNGHQIVWSEAPFSRSIESLKQGAVDIVPRTIRNEEREAFTAFLGPISYQQKDILFIVHSGQESKIGDYKDLAGVSIGVKRNTVYFSQFNQDETLRKEEAVDDANLARMFSGGRFDAIAVLDKAAIEKVFKDIGYTDFAYAKYRFEQQVGNYYGMSKASPKFALFEQLNKTLLDMASSGRVEAIYAKYNLSPSHIE